MIISTKFLGPTNYRGARVKATLVGRGLRHDGPDFSVTVSYDYRSGSGAGGAHMVAAAAVVAGWNAAVVKANPDIAPEHAPVITERFTYSGETHDRRGYIYAAPAYYAPRFRVNEAGETVFTQQ